jgi:hypothetical protein
MKTTIISFGLILLIIAAGCTRQTRSPLENSTWKVVGFEQWKGDSLLMNLGKDITGSENKVFSKTHYAYTGRYKQDTVFIDNFGGGTFKLDGNHYEENVLYISGNDQSAVGKSIKIQLELKNDTLTEKWPCNDTWELNKSGNYYIQKLAKIE